jgi:hypothetical protein
VGFRIRFLERVPWGALTQCRLSELQVSDELEGGVIDQLGHIIAPWTVASRLAVGQSCWLTSHGP